MGLPCRVSAPTLGAMTTLAERLRQARKAAQLTQAQLAAQVGTDQMTISRWERGQTQNPSSADLHAAAKALGVSVRWLLTGSDEEPEATRVPDPPFWKEFLARYEHIAELSDEDLAGIRTFAGRHAKIASWIDLERIAEIVRRDEPSPTFDKKTRHRIRRSTAVARGD